MTEPVGARQRGQQLDAMLRDITDTDEGASARRAQPREDGLLEFAAMTAGEKVAIPRISAGLARLGLATTSAAVQHSTYPLLALSMLGRVITDADERGAAMRSGMHHDRMRGALAVLEGRRFSPEVRVEMARNPCYADGVRRAETFARSLPTEELEALVGFVRRSGNEGQAAVCGGRDSGPAFEQRYETDAAFAHGVDYARRLRERDPDAFAARSQRFAELEQQQRAARERTPIRP